MIALNISCFKYFYTETDYLTIADTMVLIYVYFYSILSMKRISLTI